MRIVKQANRGANDTIPNARFWCKEMDIDKNGHKPDSITLRPSPSHHHKFTRIPRSPFQHQLEALIAAKHRHLARTWKPSPRQRTAGHDKEPGAS